MNTEHAQMLKFPLPPILPTMTKGWARTSLGPNHLDIFLESIPDQPTVIGLYRAAE
jgi:hypothetical protein